MHFKKAKSLITDSPSKIEEINEALKELEPKEKRGFSRQKTMNSPNRAQV